MYTSRLFHEPRLRAIAEIADDIADACERLTQSLAEYQQASELPQAERPEARETARQTAWDALTDLLQDSGRIKAHWDDLAAEQPQGAGA